MPVRMRAHARLGTELRGGPRGPRTHLSTLRSDPPLVLRPAITTGTPPWTMNSTGLARVCLAAAAAGPVGGDHYRLDVHVGAGSTLVLTEVSATLLLPGHDGAPSRTDVRIDVGPGGTLIWLPEPVIAAHRCDHVTDVQVDLATGARLLLREELILGRHHEPAGRLHQRIRVRRAGRPVHAQDLDLGAPAWATPVVAADHRAVGSLLLVDPAWQDERHPGVELGGQAVILPLAQGAVLVSALAADSLHLREQLAAGLQALGPPWKPARPSTD